MSSGNVLNRLIRHIELLSRVWATALAIAVYVDVCFLSDRADMLRPTVIGLSGCTA